MAIASVGTMGTGVSSTSSATFTLTTATNALASGDFAVLAVSADNTDTADGNTTRHSSVSGGTGTWTKLGEYTNTVGGAAADGVTTSLWLFEATGTVAVGTTITINIGTARVDKCASMWKFTKAAGTSIRLITGTTNPITNGTDASAGFGSVAFSGLASASRLYFRGLGKEANSTTQLTVSTSFTAITNARSRNNASAMTVYGEFRINTSTGETSNPTLAVTGDTAGVFAALEEYTPARTGTFAATETGSDTFAATGKVPRTGTFAATETGSDTFTSTGKVIVKGSLAVSETGSDTFAATGQLTSGISGTMAATESGTDAFVGTGKVIVKGSLAVSETGADVFAATGSVPRTGAFAAVETGSDSFSSTGKVVVQGALACAETGSDTFSASGFVKVQGTLAVSEDGSDTFYATGKEERVGSLAASEEGSDGFTADGSVFTPVTGGLGGGILRSSRPGRIVEAYQTQVKLGRAAVKRAKDDPSYAQNLEFQRLVQAAYLALIELAKYAEFKKRLKIQAEAKKLQEQVYEAERKAAALQQAREDEDMELLAANLW